MDKVSIFAEAILRGSGEQRRQYLDEACGTDTDLRAEIDALLAAHDDAGSFLQKTPEELAATSSGAALRANEDAWKAVLQPTDDPNSLGTLGQYSVSELIGRGGMGVVLRAHDPKLNRVVAIKMLAPELSDPVSVKRFVREAQAAAAVSHDHVVTIHAIDEDARPPIIVMEYVDGKSLQQKIDAEGILDLKSILRVGMQTASGLAAAHRQGLVHRDIKPANILLENGIERVRLTDFGLARAVDDIGMTKTGTISGTPQYMSPEQAQGEPVDHRTDLFSLGCVMYAMCTGRAAFRADSAVAVMHCVVHQVPRPVRELNEDIPDWLGEIVDKLLAKKPNDRFQNAADVERLLSQHLAHIQQPETAPVPDRISPAPQRSETVPPIPDAKDEKRSDDRQVPDWLLMKIRPWMVMIAGVIGFLSTVPTNQERIFGFVSLCIAAIVAFALSVFVRREQEKSTKEGQLYAGFGHVLGIGTAIGFAIPLLMLKGSTAVVLAILSALFSAARLQFVRTEAYAALGISGVQSDTPGWTVADQVSSRSPNPGLVGVICAIVLTPLLLSQRPDFSMFPRATDFFHGTLFLFFIFSLVLIAGWQHLRRVDDESVMEQRKRTASALAFVFSAVLAVPYLVISQSAVLAAVLTVATIAWLLLRRNSSLSGLTSEDGIGQLGKGTALNTLVAGLVGCLICVIFSTVTIFSAPRNYSVQHHVNTEPGPSPESDTFLKSGTSYRESSKEPRDPIVDLDISTNSVYTFVAFRGKLSTGYIRVKGYRSSRTVATPGIVALAASKDQAAWISGDGRPRVVTSSGGHSSRTMYAVDDSLLSVAWAPDSRLLMCGGGKGVYIWNARESGDPILTSTEVSDVRLIRWSPNRDRIAVVCADGVVVLDYSGDTLTPHVWLPSPEIAVTDLNWSPDSSHLVIGQEDGRVQLLNSSGKLADVSHQDGYECHSVSFSPDNIWVFAGFRHTQDSMICAYVNPRIDPEFVPAETLPNPLLRKNQNDGLISKMKLKSSGDGLVIATSDSGYAFYDFRDRLAYNAPNAHAPFAEELPSEPETKAEQDDMELPKVHRS